MIDDTYTVLQWRDMNSPDELYLWYTDALTTGLAERLRKLTDEGSESAKVLTSELLSLPEQALLNLVIAPETLSRVTNHVEASSATLIDFLYTSVNAEKKRYDRTLPLPTGVWSALGDVYFPKSATERAGLVSSSPKHMSEEPFVCPYLSQVIAVDFSSPYARAGYEEGLNAPANFTENELKGILCQLQSALDLIKSISVAAAHLIELFTKQIVLRKDAISSEQFRVFSLKNYTGRITIVNPQLKRWDRVTFADALLHEAIHSYLFAVEFRNGPFLENLECAVHPPKVRSPWTGSRLEAYAFIHACFVWFGLSQFWGLREADSLDSNQMRSMWAKAAAGFTEDTLVNLLLRYPTVRPDLLPLIDKMQRTAQDTNTQVTRLSKLN